MTETSKSLRIATFNIGLDQARQKGELKYKLENGGYAAAKKSAEIIQRINPDVLLINEIDGNDNGETLAQYLEKYLGKSQSDQPPLEYPYIYQPDCNTGVSSGVNFRGLENSIDNYGFGHYPGQYCMALLSRYPILDNDIHSFQNLLWKSMPDALLPKLNGKNWYSADGLNNFRLSSKNHVDVPILVNGKKVNLLISHPTPPVFDGDEDSNGKRNHDEIKFWQHYINGNSAWMRDDNGKKVNGLGPDSRFVILGDLNASTVEGDVTEHNGIRAITSLLHDPLMAEGFSELQKSHLIPKRNGNITESDENQYSQYHTAHWGMRADYVLPSRFGMKTLTSGVYWPDQSSPQSYLVTGSSNTPSSSDHRLVWLDLAIVE
ncbi:endonuclease/exonuclease/phosphatase family protein [Planctobacterium marinum]|uniref:Endonuclease n=1 Tax=Planctobacterium marinum TaxID=1631968 RepID=A0AA48KPE5_9ALTE|nr:endonuclease [Planctobacterium marinum]